MSYPQILTRRFCKVGKAGVMERPVILKKASWRKGLPSIIQRERKLLIERQKRPGLAGTAQRRSPLVQKGQLPILTPDGERKGISHMTQPGNDACIHIPYRGTWSGERWG